MAADYLAPEYQACLALLLFLGLAALRVPIAFALFTAGLAGTVAMIGIGPGFALLSRAPLEFAASWELSAVPMFLLMGNIVARAGLADVLFALFQHLTRRVPGGLAVATNITCAAFGTASGSSLAATVGVGRIAVPQMLKRGYDPGLIAGVCGCAGTIAAVIPPSIPFIIFAILTEQSVLTMFAAGLLPGLLTALAYTVMIILRARLNPAIAGGAARDEAGGRPGLRDLLGVWPVAAIAAMVIAGLYGGFATPTEAGGLGALAALIVALIRRTLDRAAFRAAIADTARTTAAILIVAVGASTLSTYLALTGFPEFVAGHLAVFADSDIAFMLVLSVVLLALGTVLDPMGVMLLALPIFLPAVEARGLDMVWFGVIAVKYIEIGLITPPLGLNLFAAHGLMPASISFGRVVRGASWFLLAEMVVMVLLLAFPAISLWLPSVIR